MSDQRAKFRQVNERNGLFVMSVLALVTVGVIVCAHSQRWFAGKFALDVLLPKAGASGLRRGDEVLMLGVPAGLVDDIIVGDDGRVNARVKIRRDFERFVRVDSSASIKKTFTVGGDSFMEISQGTGAPLPKRAPTITCLALEDSLGRIETMLAEVQAELIPVIKKAGAGLDEWSKLASELRQSRVEVSGLVARLDGLAAGVEQGKGTAGKLLRDTALTDEAQAILARADLTMSQVQDMVTNLNLAVKNVQNGTARLPEITDAVADQAKDWPALVGQTQASMRELERLVEALQRTWLVRSHVDHLFPPFWRPETDPGKLEQKAIPPAGRVTHAK